MKISLERKEMRRYSIWNQEEMEDRGLCFQGSEEPPAAAVLFCVSERAAAALRLELGALCSGLDGTTNTGRTADSLTCEHTHIWGQTTKSECRMSVTPGKASPFIVLTLPEPLLGIERALLHSNIEMDCLQSLTVESTGALKGFPGPHLSLDHSLELIADSELDPHLLLLLGRESPRCRPDTDRDSPRSGADTIPHMELELDLQEAVTLDEEAEAAQPEPEQKEQEPEQPTEVRGPKVGLWDGQPISRCESTEVVSSHRKPVRARLPRTHCAAIEPKDHTLCPCARRTPPGPNTSTRA